MTYKVGISSGWWSIGRDPNLLGLATKAGGFGATSGVTFNQVDMDSTAEFYEPRLKEQMSRITKELGLEIGLHAEIGQSMRLESAERKDWEQAHIRLIETVKHSVELGFVYINLHMSSSPQLWLEEANKKPFGHTVQMVGPDGKPLYSLAEKSAAAKKYLHQRLRNWQRSGAIDDDIIKDKHEELIKKYNKIAANEADQQGLTGPARENYISQRIREGVSTELENLTTLFEMWKNSRFGKYYIEFGEVGAYQAVAEYMKDKGDPLWKNIAKNADPTESYTNDQKGYNCAVACAYIEGHLLAKDHDFNKKYLGGKSILEFINEKKIYLLFETPEVESSHVGSLEGLYRAFDPLQFYHFIKKMGSPYIKFCIDFEHTLSQKLRPGDIIEMAPADFGKHVYLIHLGEPKPYMGKAHIPLSIGSLGQEIIYEWLYSLRKKGFTDGYMIFERGSGRGGQGRSAAEVFESSVWVIRQLVTFLDKEVKPDDLPPEFFGISEDNKLTWSRQLVEMRNHAWDPLEGLLLIPEEKHTFLSKAAVEKGKAQEWEKRKYR
jgi:sugar phosphate isomerase/epimerase